jgi:hypothetical protein
VSLGFKILEIRAQIGLGEALTGVSRYDSARSSLEAAIANAAKLGLRPLCPRDASPYGGYT